MPDIKLIQPLNNSVTEPLQQHPWPAPPLPQDDSEAEREDRSLPRAVSFEWEAPSVENGSIAYDLLISRHPDFQDPLKLADLAEPRAEVAHLFVDTPYAWKVIARDAGQPLAESPVWRFTTHRATPRWIGVPGITNVRDLGGWPLPDHRAVRQGMVYRSSQLNSSWPITQEGKDVLVDQLGIRTDLDIRWSDQEETEPVLDPARVQWINIPILGYGRICEDEDRENYPRVFEVFAQESNYPILFHCAAGADRAGTVAFMLKALLGVADEDLCCDYELTTLSGSGERSCSSEGFQGLLEALAPFGDSFVEKAENYLLSTGVSAAQFAAIRDLLIVERQDS